MMRKGLGTGLFGVACAIVVMGGAPSALAAHDEAQCAGFRNKNDRSECMGKFDELDDESLRQANVRRAGETKGDSNGNPGKVDVLLRSADTLEAMGNAISKSTMDNRDALDQEKADLCGPNGRFDRFIAQARDFLGQIKDSISPKTAQMYFSMCTAGLNENVATLKSKCRMSRTYLSDSLYYASVGITSHVKICQSEAAILKSQADNLAAALAARHPGGHPDGSDGQGGETHVR